MAVLLNKVSETPISKQIEDQIAQIASLASELGLQCGVQPAQLQLFTPSRGQEVQIGDEYHDYADGDSQRGSIVTVDLVLSPGLNRIGDGRGDMNTKIRLVPCEICPVE
jgi:hypothetical protein